MREKRKNHRLPIHLKLGINRLFRQNDEEIILGDEQIQVVDISKTGLGFICKDDLPLDYYFNCKIEFENDSFFYGVLKIIRKQRDLKQADFFNYGCEFVGLAEFLASKIDDYQQYIEKNGEGQPESFFVDAMIDFPARRKERDATANFKLFKKRIAEFNQSRGWQKANTPKNLAMSIAIEAAELMEIFQWQPSEPSSELILGDEREHIEEELADVLIYAINFANALDIDIAGAIEDKMAKNEKRFPVQGN